LKTKTANGAVDENKKLKKVGFSSTPDASIRLMAGLDFFNFPKKSSKKHHYRLRKFVKKE